jgi:hypothetical protein
MNGVEAAKATTIIVNAREKQWSEKEISFDQVVKLAYDPVPSGPTIEITVTYRKGENGKAGTLKPGESVKVHEGMTFNVVVTDKS